MATSQTRPDHRYAEIGTNARALLASLKQFREKYPEITSLGVRVTSETEDASRPEAVAKELIITIHAESQAHAEEHAAQLEEQGCHCTSTGPADAECDCSDHQ
jgi:hypothetical protein